MYPCISKAATACLASDALILRDFERSFSDHAMIPLVSFRKLNAGAAEILGRTTLLEWSDGNRRIAAFDEVEAFVARGIAKSYTNIG
jgi:hypothetical protein